MRPGDTVLDVGANVGVAAVFFAVDCEAGAVHSFEPVEPIFRLLSQNLRPYPACVAHGYGLSSVERAAEITYYPGAAAMSGLHADPERDRSLVRSALLRYGRSEDEAEAELAGRYDARRLRCRLSTVSAVLDRLSLPTVDLLKVDVERAESEVLAGIADADWPRIRQIAIEVHGGGPAAEEISRLLIDRGYETALESDEAMADTEVQMLYAVR